MKLVRGITALLAVSLLLLSATAAFAQVQEGARRGFVGTVSGFTGTDKDGVVTGAGDLTLAPLEGGAAVTILLDKGLEVRYPGQQADVETGIGVQVTTLAEAAQKGSKVAVLAERHGEKWVALQVTVVPGQPINVPVQGVVVSIQDRVLTIMRPDGTTKTVQLGPQDAPPAVGDMVTAFVAPPANRAVHPVATGLVRADEVRQRLENHLQQVSAGKVDLPDDPADRAQRIQFLSGLLENHATRLLQVLDEVLARVQGGAGAAIEKAREEAAQALQRAQEAVQKAGIRPPVATPTPTPGPGQQGQQAQPGGVMVTIASPAPGAPVSGTVQVRVNTSATVGAVAQVEFFVDNISIGVDGNGSDGWSLSWDSTTVPNGAHILRVVATRGDGQTGSHSIAVRVNNA